MSSPEIEWRRLRADQLRDMARQDALVILPLGSIEQHGPHLPLATDCLIPEAIVRAAAARTGEIGDGRVFVLPVEMNYHIRTGERDA